MTDEKLPDPTPDAATPASDIGDAPAPSAPEGALQGTLEAEQATVDQMLDDLMDDTEKAALYRLLSIC